VKLLCASLNEFSDEELPLGYPILDWLVEEDAIEVKPSDVLDATCVPFTNNRSVLPLYTTATCVHEEVVLNEALIVTRVLLLATEASRLFELIRKPNPFVLPPKSKIILLFEVEVGLIHNATVLALYPPSLGNPPLPLLVTVAYPLLLGAELTNDTECVASLKSEELNVSDPDVGDAVKPRLAFPFASLRLLLNLQFTSVFEYAYDDSPFTPIARTR